MIEHNGRRYFVMDAHTHMGESEILTRFNLPAKYWGEAMVASMDAAGVDAVVTFPLGAPHTDYRHLNARVLEAQAQFPDRICAFARIQPLFGANAVADLREYLGTGFRGVKLHPYRDGTYMINDRKHVYPLFEVIAEFGVPVLIHSGGTYHCTPALIAELARDFPTVRIIVGHTGQYGGHYEAFAVAPRHENLYLETSMLWPPGAVKTAVNLVGKERVLFGTDHPVAPFGYDLDKVVKYAGLTADEIAHVAGLNIARLVNLDTSRYR